MSEAENSAPAEESRAEAPAQEKTLEQKIEDWFFNHFHQQTVLNHPDVFNQAVAAKSELLKLLGL